MKTSEFRRRAEEVILREINPVLARDNGFATLTDLTGGVATVRLEGACANCPFMQNTFRSVVCEVLQKELPQIREIRLDESEDEEFLRIARQFLTHTERTGGR